MESAGALVSGGRAGGQDVTVEVQAIMSFMWEGGREVLPGERLTLPRKVARELIATARVQIAPPEVAAATAPEEPKRRTKKEGDE